MTSLFREEALQAKRHGLESRVLFVQPPKLIFFAVFAAAILATIFVFAVFGEFTNRTPVLGSIVPRAGVQRIFSPTPGVVSKKFFKNEQIVRKGESLYTVVAERYTNQQKGVETAVAAFAGARRKSIATELSNIDALEASERCALNSTIRELARQITTMDEQIVRQKTRAAIAANARKRYQSLLRLGYVTTDQAQDREAAYLDQVGALNTLQREKSSIAKDLGITETDLLTLEFKYRGQREQLHRASVTAEQDILESEVRREIHILSPADGVASGAPMAVGDAVDTAKPLLTVVPDDHELIAELYVPRFAIGFVQPGANVYLRYDAFPYQKYGLQLGKVLSISMMAVPTPELAVAFGGVPKRDMEGALESYYRLAVELPSTTINAYGQPRTLKPGMTLTADVELEKKKLYEWLLDPVVSSRGCVKFF